MSKSGKPLKIDKVCAAAAAAADSESLCVSVIGLDDSPVAALLGLGDGDSVALSGILTPKVWTDKRGETRPSPYMVASQVLTAYNVTRNRQSVESPPESQRRRNVDFPSEPVGF